MNSYDSIIIGGGISGLLSALVLSKSGKKVLLLERNRNLGNNCNSYSVDGYQVDTGPHAITQLQDGGPLRYLMENYFDYLPAFVDYGDYFIRDEDGLKEVPTTLKGYLTMDILPRKDRLIIAQSLTKMLLSWQFGTDISNISVYQCLPWNTLSPDTKEFMDTFSYFLSGKSAKETSVQRMFVGGGFIEEDIEKDVTHENNEHQYIDKFKKMSYVSRLLNNNKVNYNQYYPRNGLKAILDAILYSLPENVEIKTDTAVENIITVNSTAKGVVTKEGSYFADTIIYSGFAKDLPKYTTDLPASYISDLSRIKQSKALTIWLGLDEEFEEFNYVGGEVWFKNKPFWAMPISNYNKNFAPGGKKLVGFMFSIDGNNSFESEKLDAYNTILRVYPGINNYIDMVHYQMTIPEKASVAINGFIAETVTPIKNLYLVGTDVDDRSMGITRAAYSVVKLITVLKKERIIDS
ncbi:UDP-galactopyranose mutase [Methanosarcina sp. 2.H.T.1A.6]|uniref:phytoene desaturase family protein n=1 Tax=unclassified Methanosarcina TaxID=2644672 RepID=UPI000622A61B|nr:MULTISPECIES: NAD(P)/FAD-dependent oxidoreductase [unclassified Methanosarcina]KKG10502.1 UDP-galactopyranose mutase [Methanosarcina sp. 2.H.T.1A.15]KKG13973.1 UDP-galactopyranose mutase [Methanosarcina sp. 2.H.T.1A.3]KKG20886.1 UDP-galactopyranose mutase [Methanosarcina sp. 2.H.T.1A.6]KKG25152.1 UDP-galactopyranose mutase [Methanosarcina sp. 2.H.T.1A.8]